MPSGTFYPAVSGDDGHWVPGDFYNTLTQMYFGMFLEGIGTFIRCPNITIPQGSTITEAYVKFTAYSSLSSTVVNVNVYFNDVDDAIAPTSSSEGNALFLTSPITWNGVEAWTDGVQYDTPNLVSILQSVINRAGWSSGNALQVVIKDNGSSGDYKYRSASTIDYLSGAEKAELHITWTAQATEVIKDLSTEIAANPTTEFLDLLSDVRASVQIFRDLKSSIEATFLTDFANLKTEIYSKAQKLLDLLSDVRAGNQIITDLKLDINAKGQTITDLKTFIKAITWNFRNLNTSIEAVRSKWWLNTEIKAGCAARWNFNTEWNPGRFLNAAIEAKKPYEFSFKTQTDEDYAATDPEIEFKISGYSFPLRTLFLDYIAVGGTNIYPLELWWARGKTGSGTLKNAKIRAEYINTQDSGGFEIINCGWLSCKVGDGEYNTVNDTPLFLGDLPCDSKFDLTLKVECRDCSLSRGLIFFKLIITGDQFESVYGGPTVYRDGKLYHSGIYDDYSSQEFICRLYVAE